MNKTSIKNFAVWARNKLIADVTYRAGLMGIAEDGIKPALPQSTRDTEFYDIGTKEPYSITGEAVRQRGRLKELIEQKAESSDYKTAYSSVLEEVAYTWFNRLIAIRFMEVNDYLPSRIRVLSSESKGKLEPDLVSTPFDAELELSDAERETIMRLKTDNQVDVLFRLLFVKQCNALNQVLPKLFEKTADYTELLLNVSVTDQDGIVYHLVHDINEDDFNIEKGGQVEIIGWLYQYYNTEPKEEAFALLKKNVKITKERIPAVTQLFTPDWIVRYMVENSLGRLWIEHERGGQLSNFTYGELSGKTIAELEGRRMGPVSEESLAKEYGWKYYLPEAEQDPEVEEQLRKIRESYQDLCPEDIKVIDPCMGSGHILVYAFDVLMQIYEAAGYTKRDAAKSILENNLYGLDIDDRAFQLAYFAVMMKARQYNRRILNGETDCHVYSIQESNTVNRNHLKYLGAGMEEVERDNALNQLIGLLDTFVDAKEYGSILNVDDCDWDLLRRYVAQSGEDEQMSMDTFGLVDTKEQLRVLIDIGQVLAQKYDTCVTNPPYMGSGGMGARLSDYVKKNYPDSKSDMSTVSMECTMKMCAPHGYMAMINIPVWMFLTSYSKLRRKILSLRTIDSMLHLGRGVFGADFGTTAFVIRNERISAYKGVYRRLFEKASSVDSEETKKKLFFSDKKWFYAKQESFMRISDTPIVYWLSDTMLSLISSEDTVGKNYDVGSGLSTADNERFLRYHWEVSSNKIAESGNEKDKKWFHFQKGGEFRRWYGNLEYVVNWENDGADIKYWVTHNPKDPGTTSWSRRIFNVPFYFQHGITWAVIGIGKISFRETNTNAMISNAAGGVFTFSSNEEFYNLLGGLNSKIWGDIFQIISPTVNYSAGIIQKAPMPKAECSEIVKNCITISKHDWDAFETSWDFQRHPLLCGCSTIEAAYAQWEVACNERFTQLKANEEELNRLFIDIYGLQEELTPEVEDKDVTVRKADLGRDIRSLISYAVGCMFGRYSLDVSGLAYAGGEWDDSKYSSFIPDKDNILPITDEEYFPDDIVGLFCGWLKKVYGADTLEDNLDFIAKALGNKGNTSREIIRNYFVNNFIKDHIKTYQKRPIYWLFDSGKQNGFKALIYVHRYDENTIGNLRIDYLHRMERVYDNEIARMQDIIDNSKVAREVTQATKRREKLQKQLKECKEYDERIAHLALARTPIELDDGVKVNYEKVQTVDGVKYPVLAKI